MLTAARKKHKTPGSTKGIEKLVFHPGLIVYCVCVTEEIACCSQLIKKDVLMKMMLTIDQSASFQNSDDCTEKDLERDVV